MTLDAVEGLHAGSGASARLRFGGGRRHQGERAGKYDVVTVKKDLGTIEQAVGKCRFRIINAQPE